MIQRRGIFVRLRRDRRGALMAEVAIALAVVLSLIMSGLEFARYILLHQKMERVAASVADLVAQSEILSEADVTNIMAAVEHVAKPFSIVTMGRVVVSSVGASGGNPPTMYWQRSGGGAYAATSQVGTPGGSVSLPSGFTVSNGSSVIIAEVFYNYTPWIFPEVISPGEVYQSAFFRPRFGPLTQVD